MPDEPMPPLGPPYGPALPPPPPHFPDRPPTEWALHATIPEPSGPHPPASPPPGPNRTLIAVVAAIVAVVLGVAAIAWIVHDDSPTRTATAPRRTTTTTTEPSSSTDDGSSDSSDSSSSSQPLDAAVTDIKAFVEKERGLKFLSDVPVELADDKQFTDELLADFDKDQASVKELGQILTALGLVDHGDDVVDQERQLVSAGVVGFYDPETKRLVVRGTDTTPYVRQVLAHELTHALEDQHFDLNRPQLDTADDETGFGFSALAEGSARRIEDAYVATLSGDEQQAALEEQTALVAQNPQIFSLPPVLLNLLQAPYDAGQPFVDRLVAEGGNARIDAAYGAPPVTSEQIYEPSKFLAGEGPVAVADPTPDGAATAENRGVLGVVMLQQLLDPGGLGGTSLDPTVEHWGGDKYVTWTDGDSTCLKDVVVGDDQASTIALFDAFNDWAAGPGVSATITRDGADPAAPFAITSCA